jgi:hypothetical protein
MDENVQEPVEQPTSAAESAEAPIRRRRVARTEDAPVDEPTAKLTTYRVMKAAIAPNGGGRDALVRPGETVELTKEQAKYYASKGFLAPVIED